MQKQIRLFLNAAEMLVFNTMFVRNQREIRLTRRDYENLSRDVKEAKVEGDLVKFIDDFIAEMVGCGLLARVAPASEELPIGALCSTIEKKEIAGPQYIVERGIFQIAVPLRMKSEPALEPAPCAPETISSSSIKRIIDLPEYMLFSRINKLLMCIFLSSFANKWFLLHEIKRFLKMHDRAKIFGGDSKGTLAGYFLSKDNRSLFEIKDITDEERAARGLDGKIRHFYRLSEKGKARAQANLKSLAETIGADYESLINKSFLPLDKKEIERESAPALPASSAQEPAPAVEPKTSEMAGAVKRIVDSSGFMLFSRINRLLVCIFLSPFADKWFLLQELNRFFEMHDGDKILGRGYKKTLNRYIWNQSYSSLFEKKDVTDKERAAMGLKGRSRHFYRLSEKGRARAQANLKALAKTIGVDYESLVNKSFLPRDKMEIEAESAPALPSAQEPAPAVEPETPEMPELGKIVGNKIFGKMSRIDKILIFIRVSALAYRWFLSRELKAFIHSLPDISRDEHLTLECAVNETLPPLAKKGYLNRQKLQESDEEGKGIHSECRVEYSLNQKGRARATKLLARFRHQNAAASSVPLLPPKRLLMDYVGGLINFNRIGKTQGHRSMPAIDMMIIFVGLSSYANSWFSGEEIFEFIAQRTNPCPMTLPRLLEVLMAYSRRKRDPFHPSKMFPRENEDIEFCLSRFGKQRFFELIKVFSR